MEIAEILDISPQTVSNTLNSDLGKQKLSVMRKGRDEKAIEVSEKIDLLTDKALRVYNTIFDNEDGSINIDMQKKTADTVTLDLKGLRSPTKIQSFQATATMQEIEEFKKRGIQAQREAGMIIDIEEEEEEDDSLV